jgi:hypothetical protein
MCREGRGITAGGAASKNGSPARSEEGQEDGLGAADVMAQISDRAANVGNWRQR